MVDLVSIISVLLIFSVVILYRYIRVGKSSLLFFKGDLIEGQNYKKAEFFRFIQIIIGFILLLAHSILFFGLKNAVLFFTLCIMISFVVEFLGVKTGVVFGGYYTYDNEKNGPMFFGVPILILITWFGLIYMSFNYSIYILDLKNLEFYNLDFYGKFKICIFSSILVAFLDLVLDPIAVDEKRWLWKHPGFYYGVPILNFIGWFFNCLIILTIFSYNPFNFIVNPFNSVSNIPVYLFLMISLIACRPCFERNLKFPGIFGIFFSVFLIILLIIVL